MLIGKPWLAHWMQCYSLGIGKPKCGVGIIRMIAMTAARLGRIDQAIEILLRDGVNNRYLPNGYCPQEAGGRKYEIAAYCPLTARSYLQLR